jgi:hypothetical protein
VLSESKGQEVETAKHPVYALTTSELAGRRSALKRAIAEVPAGAPVPVRLRDSLGEVIAEEEQRARIRQASRRSDNQDHYSVRQLSTAELERTKRDLTANLGLLTPVHLHMCQFSLTCGQSTLSLPRAGNEQASGALPR